LIFFLEMANHPVDDFIHQFSVEIFDEDYYPDPNASSSEPVYRRHDNLPLPQNLNYQPQPQSQQTFTQHEIIEELQSHVPTPPSSVVETPNPSVPPSPMEAEPTGKRKRPFIPTYDAPWWHFYEMTKDASGVLISAKCKVKNYKVNYRYIKSNNLSSFKKHANKHLLKNEEPQEHADNLFVQSVINSDGSRTHQRYDGKKMLSEFARYIAHKEQLISMDNCLSFARLVIRGCTQPSYKIIHHRKMVNEIKKTIL
jgi:hypothetical protein